MSESSTTLALTRQPSRSLAERSRSLTWCWALLLVAACSNEPKSTRWLSGDKLYNFDSLIDDQVSQLSQRMRVLEKSSELDGKKSDSTFLPSLNGWADELAAFRQLETMNRPANRNVYTVEDPIKDIRSNLKVRQYEAPSSQVPLVKFFYQKEFSRLRKIEAVIQKKNMLYAVSRVLMMEFEEEDNKPILSRYSMSGYQKIPFSDTVRFSVSGQVEW